MLHSVTNKLSKAVHSNEHNLLKAAKTNNRTELTKYLAKGIDINVKSKKGNTALMHAYMSGHIGMIEFLLDAGANPNTQNAEGTTVLMPACARGQVEIVKLLLTERVNPTYPNIQDFIGGTTALMRACASGQVEIVKLLLNAGADPNMQDNHGVTALRFATGNGINQVEIVKLLLDAGANPNMQIQNDGYRTVLMGACVLGQEEIVKLLLHAGANPNLLDIAGTTALALATRYRHIEIVELLRDAGADPNLQNKEGKTLLMHACAEGELDIVKLLLAAGATPNIQDQNGIAALGYATGSVKLEIVKELLKAGADVCAKNKSGRTVLEELDYAPKEFVTLLQHEMRVAMEQNKGIGEIRKIARVLNQVFRNQDNRFPNEILQGIASYCFKNTAFDNDSKFNTAWAVFFKKPPTLKTCEGKEEEYKERKFIYSLKHPSV